MLRWMLAVVALVAGLCVGAEVTAAQTSTAPSEKRALRVVTTIQPLRGLVDPMLKDAGIDAEIETLIPPGVSEHGYELPPAKLAALAKADVVVLVGLGMEPQVEKFLKDRPKATGGKDRRVVIAAKAAGVKDDDDHDHAHDHAHHDHDHGDDDHPHHHGTDPHVWLDPVLSEKIVSAAAEQIRAALGDDAEAARKVWVAEEAQIKRLKELNAKYERTLKPAKSRVIVVGHDAWGHLAKRYALTTVAIAGLTASEPTPMALENAARTIREKGVTTVFVEPQLGEKAGRRIAEMTNTKVAMLDPLGDGDYFKMMNANLAAIAKALGVEMGEKGEETSAK